MKVEDCLSLTLVKKLVYVMEVTMLQQHGGSSGQWAGSSWQPPGGSVGASGGEAAASPLRP